MNRVVWIKWIDSAEAVHGWEPPSREDAEVPCLTVGFVVKETRRHIWVTTTLDTVNNHSLNQVRIWKRSIQEMREVEWQDVD